MKKQKVTRLYHLSDGDLISKSKEKIAFMRRDIEAFKPFGITTEMITDLENEVEIFSDMPTDIEVKSDIMLLTERRKAKAEELRVALRDLMHRVQMTYGIKTAKYKAFGTGTLSKKVGANLLLAGKTAIEKAYDFMPKLSPHGVTTEMLDSISALGDELENLILEQKMKTGDRTVLQEIRIMVANIVYAKLKSYTATGLGIWETKSRARYNDYVLYAGTKKEVITI